MQPSKKRADSTAPETTSTYGAVYTIEEFISEHQSGEVLWDRLVDLARECGPFEFAAGKTRSAFLLRARFLTVYTLSNRGISFVLSMATAHEHSRFRKVFRVGAHEYAHDVRVNSLDELDAELGELICLAYQWGLVGEK